MMRDGIRMMDRTNGKDCETLSALLSGFADGEISGSERLLVERHVTQCESCRTTLKTYQSLGTMLRSELLEKPVSGLESISWPPRLIPKPDQVTSLTRRRRVFYDAARWATSWPAVAAVAAVVALTVGTLLQVLPSEQRPIRSVEIDRLEAAGPVMVFQGNGGRMTIIWIYDSPQVASSTT